MLGSRTSDRQRRGKNNYENGLAAEEIVARGYVRGGFKIAAQRWRGLSGEIDLVIRDGDELIFVEVKKATDFAQAAESLTISQLNRIRHAATEFVADEPDGLLTPMRFDLALVNAAGETEILQNISMD